MSRAAARQTGSDQTEGRAARSTKAERPNLRLVDPRVAKERTRRRRIVAISMVVLVAGMFVVAYAQARLVEGQHELDQLRTEVAEAQKIRARLERDVVEASSPTSITDRARALGMVRAVDPLYIVAVDTPDVAVDASGVAGEPVAEVVEPLPAGGPATADVELSVAPHGTTGS